MRPLLLLLFLPTLLHAQAPAYPGESAVLLSNLSTYTFNPDGTGTRQQTLAVRIQSEAALRELSVLNLPFASASEKVEILYARSRHPDGTLTETPTAGALDQPLPVTLQAPFYSDLKSTQLPIRSLRVGDTLEWSARITRTKPEAPNNFWGQETFTSDALALSETLELHVPKSVPVTVWTNPRLSLKPTESDSGSEHIYRWQHSNLTPTAGPEAEAAKATKKKTLLTPDQEQDQREGVLPSIAWTTFPSWAAVGDWYRTLESGRTTPDADIKAKVAELTAGKSTEQQKVEAVYSFVAPQIRYIGVAFGVGRYQPHHAEEILSNQYGDCKDKHTLLAAMLQVLGLHPDAVLIGQGVRFNPAVPSPAAFNHLITRVTLTGNQPIWLDATAEVAPYRLLNFQIRDKQALVVPDSGAATIERTPAEIPFPSSQVWTAVGAINKDGVSDSHLTLALRGDMELLYRMAFRSVSPAQYSEAVQTLSRNIGYGGSTSHPDISRPDDTSQPFTISYDYRREQGEDWVNTRVVPQLAPLGLPAVNEKEPPIASIELGPPHSELSNAELKLPEKWTAQLPEAIHEKSPWATVDTTYRLDKGTVYSERKLVILARYVPAADWKAYKKFTDAISLGDESFIVLHHFGTTNTPPAPKAEDEPGAVSSPNAEAARLITQAFAAMQKADYTAVSPLLEQAKALNPTQAGLYGAFGSLTYGLGDPAGSIHFYQQEVSLHPESTWVYRPLYFAQRAANKRPAALDTLQTWTANSPSDPEPPRLLIQSLLEDNRPADALAAADKAIANLPASAVTDPAFQLTFGKAEFAAGQKPAGAKTLATLLANSEDPGILNDAAYELADAFLELPLAESSSRKSLDKLTAETTAWTLDEDPKTLRQKSALLVASWDTYGWILFRQGKLQQAQDYIHAAWTNDLHAEVGEHLGDVQTALQNPQAALETYILTLSTNPDEVRRKRLQTKIDAAKAAGAKPLKQDTQQALIDLRTLQLGPAANRKGSAEYFALIGHDKIHTVKPTGDHPVAGGTELIQSAKPTHLVPTASDARLARLGILNCVNAKCSLILEP